MTAGIAMGRALRPSSKVLPEHARGHNRALVLQTLYSADRLSRADVARETGLTKVTVSDLVAELIVENLLIEVGQREDARPGKPATLLTFNRNAAQIIGVDLSDHAIFRGAVLTLDGQIVERAELPIAAAIGKLATGILIELVERLISLATLPILGVGVGSPGVVDSTGQVLAAPNLGWHGEPLQHLLAERFKLPVVVANDANVAALAEHGLGGGEADMLLVTIGHGVGSGLVLQGMAISGPRHAAGEIGHVVVGTDGGPECACGRFGCLEAWLAVPRLRQAIAAGNETRDSVLQAAGTRLGIALAPVVGALDLTEVVLTGPQDLIEGPLLAATAETLHERTLAEFHGHLNVRRSQLGSDIVTRGAAVMVLATRLGVS